jgi:HD-GYP domain-containing protein (c-di-GMP phosphodiesterase class II)/YHS domain-containing protein
MTTRDPVCNLELADDAKESLRFGGRNYSFCSAACRQRFEKNSALFSAPGGLDPNGTGEICRACGNRTSDPIYTEGKGPYCCERCSFRDLFLGGVLDKVENNYLTTMEAFAAAIDAREHETGDHSYRVTQYAAILGRQVGLGDRELVDLYCGALLHDLGKIGIPDAILLKEGPLTREERLTMNTHPEIGYGIINRISYLARAAEIIRSHHEHFDGSGYPRQLKGEAIPFGARIFSICDNLDALTVQRPYHQAQSFAEVAAYIENEQGRLFDPEVVRHFTAARSQLQDYVDRAGDL